MLRYNLAKSVSATPSSGTSAMHQSCPDSHCCDAFNISVLDSLALGIVVLDAQGTVVSANMAWRQFAEECGIPEPGRNLVGMDYLAACEQALHHPHGKETEVIRDGIGAVLSGAQAEFHLDYHCHTPSRQRWCRMRISRLQGTQPGSVIAYEDITEPQLAEIRLRQLSTAVEQNPASIVITDPGNNIQYVNPQFEHASGYAAAEVIGQNPRILQAGKKSSEDYQAMWQTLASGEIWRGEFENKRKDGSHYWEHASISPIYSSDGLLTGYVGVKKDITERKRAEERMREALVVFNAVPTAILTTDATGTITAVNPAFTTITGYAPEEVIGHDPSLLKSGRHDDAFYRNMQSTLAATGSWEAEIWNKRKNGEIYPQWQSITAVRDDSGNIVKYVAVFSDITERKQQEDAIWRQANFDALTGLANRNLLRDRLERALSQARRSGKMVGVIFLDLDGFKEINDTLGHDAGDELLIDASMRLKACVRDQDTVARMGGDEFTVVAPGLSETEDLRAISEKLVNVLREPFLLRGNRYRLSGSVGIAVFPDHGEDVQTLLKNADIAMYKSKQAGKDCFMFFATCA